jgi:succinate dehydrogenase/fumarate reductase flavoprotein subunit
MLFMETRFLDADLLIIGGGSAGCMAAIRALELNPKMKVVIFEKGDIKYSGSIARGMDALNIVAIPNFTTPELYLEAITAGCEAIVDAPASHLMAARSFDLLKKLQRWGVYFPVDKSGNFRTLKYHVKGRFQTAMEEPDLKVMISQRALSAGAIPVNRVMGLRVLLDDGRVAGAVGLNVRTGELAVCKAKAVILAAGGQARFSLPNSGHLFGTFDFPGNSGDGFLMAYRAGAALTGMEHAQRLMLIKDANMPLLAITVTRGGRVMDVFDNVLMENEVGDMKAMEKAFTQGYGPLRIQLKHLKPETIDEIEHILFSTERPVQERFFKGRGVDFRKTDIELWPTETQVCGGHGMAGAVVNSKAETGVPGLYAAGDVACVPKQHLTGAFVFGEVAAESAATFIHSHPKVNMDSAQWQSVEQQRDERFTKVDREIEVKDLEYKVRRFIGDYVISPKNAYKLNRWAEWARRFEAEIQNKVLVRNAHELARLYEVEHIVECASLSARASLERKESRWGQAHHRTDYPDRDDANWLCHVVLKQGDDARDIRTSLRPVVGLDDEEDGA